MSIFPNFSAIIFDMDGLVLDTEITYLQAWQQAVQKMGYQLDEHFFLSLSGLDSATVKNRLLEYCGSKFNLNYFHKLSSHYWYANVRQHGIKKKKGLESLLNVIKIYKIPYCLATNSIETNARECLAFANLTETFKLIISRDQVKQGKPAPDIFLKAAKLLQQPINNCLVLEDSLIGIKAAQRAGAYSILIPSQPMQPNEQLISHKAIFNDLTEVSKFILVNRPKI